MRDTEIDRREYERVPFVVPVNLVHEQKTYKGYWTHDVSEGGLRLEFLPVAMNSRVKVLVPLPAGNEDRHFLLDGEVVWRNFKSTGIRFLNPPEDVRDYVRGFIHDQTLN